MRDNNYTRNSFWVIDLQEIREAKKNNSPHYASLIRSKTKEYQNNPDFLVSLIEIAGTQIFYWQLPPCILESDEYMKMAVLADSKCLKFIPENKLKEDILLQVVEGQHLENLFVIPHVTKKLTFSLCHLALKKKPDLCLMNFFKTEPKLELSREERQILYAQLVMNFKSLGQKLPPYLDRYESISDKLTPESLDKMVGVLSMRNKLHIHLPEKINESYRVKI